MSSKNNPIPVKPDTLAASYTIQEKADRVKAFRKEASRMASLVNKRMQRLEKNNLQDSPAYQSYLKTGGKKFSVRGKTYNQVQAMSSQLRALINARTATVRGAVGYAKEIAANVGIKYSSVKELQVMIPKFFELQSKIEQNIRMVDDMASAIGYQKIWESISTYTQTNNIDLASSEKSLDEMIEDVTQIIREYENPEYIETNPTDDGRTFGDWFTLPLE